MSKTHFSSLVTIIAATSLVIGCGADLPPEITAETKMVSTIRDAIEAATDGGTADSAVSVAQPTGFATLRGTFKLQGNPPAPTALDITKDASVCAPGGQTVYSPDVVVDPSTGGIANIVIFADKIPDQWCHESAAPGKTDEVVFDQKECVFLTHVVAMQTTQTLKALNSDPVGHNLMVGSFNQTIPSNGFSTYQPNKQERKPIVMRCAVHPWMQAYMITRDNSYFAVTKPDGSFEIPNLPAGVKLEFRVWQERIGPVKTATVDGAPEKWSKGKFSRTLEPGTEVNMDVVLDANLF